MYYNIGLLESLQQYNENLQEPAQIFLDGDWTFSKFEAYCDEVQATMAEAFGEAGTAGGANQEYWAVSGWDSYWWVGLGSNDGEPLADTTTMTINIDTPHKVQAAEVVKNLYTKKVAASPQSVDQNVTQWNEGKALFNTGDLWFVGADNRWSMTLWGDDTRYGYVPWPRANDIEFEDIKVALGGTATWVMPIGRDYSQYGDECTAENIYWAIAELYRKSDEIHKSSPDYDAVAIERNLAAKFAHSDASQQAYIYIQELIKAGKGYYDPLVTSDNSVGSLYTNSASRQTIKGAVTQYCATGAVGTWEEAIAALKPILQESLRKAYS
jgi:ABC-type glycerol-3-phosphate transport system substrate-binding protein